MTDIEDAVAAIQAVVDDNSLPREVKVAKLKALANEVWDAVFPERSTPAYQKLSNDERVIRWRSVDQRIGKAKDDFRIRYVLDWPASGGNFYWVK